MPEAEARRFRFPNIPHPVDLKGSMRFVSHAINPRRSYLPHIAGVLGLISLGQVALTHLVTETPPSEPPVIPLPLAMTRMPSTVEFDTDHSHVKINNFTEATINVEKANEVISYFEDVSRAGVDFDYSVDNKTMHIKLGHWESRSKTVYLYPPNALLFYDTYNTPHNKYDAYTRYLDRAGSQTYTFISVKFLDNPPIGDDLDLINWRNNRAFATELCQSEIQVRVMNEENGDFEYNYDLQDLFCNSLGGALADRQYSPTHSHTAYVDKNVSATPPYISSYSGKSYPWINVNSETYYSFPLFDSIIETN